MKHRFRYRGFGLLIDSELQLPELSLSAHEDNQADVVIRLGTVPRVRRRATMKEELAINIVGAAFLIAEGREITVDPLPHADPAAVRVVLLGRVMAFLFRQRGWLPLHASGVVVRRAGEGDHSVLFLGASGAGKSTTAAAFHKAGHLVVTDDVAAVRVEEDGRCVLQAASSYVRLQEEGAVVLGSNGYSSRLLQIDKYRFDLTSATLIKDQYPVRCAYVVEYGESARVDSLLKLESIALLSSHSFVKFRNTERESLERHLSDCAAVAQAIPVRRLIRPKSLRALSEVVRLVEDDLKE